MSPKEGSHPDAFLDAHFSLYARGPCLSAATTRQPIPYHGLPHLGMVVSFPVLSKEFVHDSSLRNGGVKAF